MCYSYVGYAQSNCLKQVSNQELLNEIGQRMSLPGDSTSGVILDVTCASSKLIVSATSLSNGMSADASFQLGSSFDCSQVKDVIWSKKEKLKNGGQFAVCESALLNIVTVAVNGKLVVKKIQKGSSFDCSQDASKIN